MAKELKIVFLGGVGEIGKNMTALEYGEHILIIDAGLSFPNSEEMPGIDYVIPDFSYLVQNKEKVKGIVLTHGHEDHIGALPYVLKEIEAPVYGSNLAIALMEHKLNEQKVKHVEAHCVEERETVSIGCFQVEFVRVTHSIAGSFALAITTPRGVVFHTGDFKIDHTPIDGRHMDLPRIAEIGKKGVLLLLQDSTNAERDGFSMSERNVGKSLNHIFAQNTERRMIVATFASNIHRVQQIINCALKFDRKIAFSGRSMENIARIASQIGELKFPADKVVDIDKIASVPYDRLCIITSGTQGEPESALARMSVNEFKKVKICETDTIVLSASPIPGNEKMIYRVINNLYRRGAEVVYEALSAVHVSGHACREELKMMFSLLRPKYFVPVHGEYRHLKRHSELAEMMGIPRANITIPQLGQVFDVSKAGLKQRTPVSAGSIMLDGSLQESSELLLKDRKLLAEDGIVIAIANISAVGSLQAPPFLITRGLTLSEQTQEEIKAAIERRFSEADDTEIDGGEARNMIRKATAKTLYNHLKRRPMVIPITIES